MATQPAPRFALARRDDPITYHVHDAWRGKDLPGVEYLMPHPAETLVQFLNAGYPAPHDAPAPLSGAARIATERRRQVEEEGYDAQHDERHEPLVLAVAAMAYLRTAFAHGTDEWDEAYTDAASWWSWAPAGFKPKDPVRDLERAGAFIAAALDRYTADQQAAEYTRAEALADMVANLGVDVRDEDVDRIAKLLAPRVRLVEEL